jgi:hypothetical protein
MANKDNLEETINSCIGLFAGFLGIETYNPPTITMNQAEPGTGGSYNLKSNILNIDPSQVGDGTCYFEEVAHYLRHQLVEMDDVGAGPDVEEFLGRLGEDIGRNLTKGTELEYLFESHPPRRFSDMATYSKIFENHLDYAFSLVKDYDEACTGTISLRNIFAEDINEKVRIIKEYLGDKDLNKLLVGRKLANASLAAKLSENKDICYLASCDDAITGYLETVRNDSFNHYAGYVLSMKKLDCDVSGDVDLLISHLDLLGLYVDSFSRDIDSFRRKLEFEQMLRYTSELTHYIGYISAEKYAEANPQFMEEAAHIFRQPSSEIRAQFIKDEAIKPYQDRGGEIVLRKCAEYNIDLTGLEEEISGSVQ